IKMSSVRVKGAEALNGENLKGYYVADGATYIMVDGNEYNNIFPVWNWRKLPGVTCYQSNAPLKVLTFDGYRNNSDFTGGLSNGLNGITAFHLVRDSLTAKKAWFFIDNVMVCLGADITSDKDEPVTTTLNQSFLKGDVYYFDGSVKKMNLESQISSDDFKWVYHNKIAYYPLQKTQLIVSDKTKYGDWHEIAKVYPSKKQSANIFSIDAEHGKSPQHESYSYVILPAITLDEATRYEPTFTVIENKSNAQVVSSKDKKLDMFVVYDPVKLSVPGTDVINFEQAGIYMLEQKNNKWFMTMADPTHKLKTFTFTINNKKYSMDLPQNEDLGKSISKEID
ncbi:MAG TPA: polysaccharide lyase family 8 super-sandwich domain-containing protein, partial [Hanamia sp.]